MASQDQLNRAFLLAGVTIGDPNQGTDADLVFAPPADVTALRRLFKPSVIATLQRRVGETPESILNETTVDGIGFVEFLAAEILQTLAGQNIDVQGRSLDITNTTSGGFQQSFEPSATARRELLRRASELRTVARNAGGEALMVVEGPPGPKGDDGRDGDRGPAGPEGPVGPVGAKGDDGVAEPFQLIELTAGPTGTYPIAADDHVFAVQIVISGSLAHRSAHMLILRRELTATPQLFVFEAANPANIQPAWVGVRASITGSVLSVSAATSTRTPVTVAMQSVSTVRGGGGAPGIGSFTDLREFLEETETGASSDNGKRLIDLLRSRYDLALPIPSRSSETQVWKSRNDAAFWEAINEVPDTPGTSSGVGHVLTVTGENDGDYAWRAPTGGGGGSAGNAPLSYREVTGSSGNYDLRDDDKVIAVQLLATDESDGTTYLFPPVILNRDEFSTTSKRVEVSAGGFDEYVAMDVTFTRGGSFTPNRLNITIAELIRSYALSVSSVAVMEGAAGSPGPQGPAGMDGAPGPAGGPQGPQGPQGEPGPAGPMGVKGSDGTPGETGPRGAVGPEGPIGRTGERGDPGPQGIQGFPGVQGPKGDRGDTGPPGMDGSAADKGDKGDPGDRGPVGPQGPQGDQGAQGVAGPQGPDGDRGDTGPAGPQGARGPTGPAGSLGAEGPRGDIGPAGPAGPIGPKGDRGDTGVQGPQGDRGDVGPMGIPGTAAEKGDKGDTGDRGPVGPQGPKGDQGAQGVAGPQGPEGDRGDTGATGPQGAQGPTGATGPQGPQGERGDVGPAGPTGAAGAAGAAGSPGPKGDRGDTGVQGPKGDRGDVGPMGIPGTAAEKGDKGDTGDRGPVGPQGPKGDQGAQGVAGPQGPEGDRGDTGATGPQGAQGPTGATGPEGPQGERGDTGATGPQGAQGLTGATGPEGPQGERGDTGATGPQGAQGPAGPQGLKGDRGDRGEIGPAGPKGDPGSASTFVDPFLVPSYWLLTTEQRDIDIHIDPRATAGATSFNVRLQGITIASNRPLLTGTNIYTIRVTTATAMSVNSNVSDFQTLTLQVTFAGNAFELRGLVIARRTPPSTFADPFLDPSYWLLTTDARNVILHLDPNALTGATAFSVRLGGVPLTLNQRIVSGDNVYTLAVTAVNAGTIARNHSDGDSIPMDVTFTGNDNVLRTLVLGRSAAPGGGGGWKFVISGRFNATSSTGVTNILTTLTEVKTDVLYYVILGTAATAILPDARASTTVTFYQRTSSGEISSTSPSLGIEIKITSSTKQLSFVLRQGRFSNNQSIFWRLYEITLA